MSENNPEFNRNKNQIRTFCQRATHTGGVLLVAGIRGVGKTRLVDEALNERNKQGSSCRVEIMREPRKVPRYLIKVDVDPFFPTDQKLTEDEGNNSIDENALAFTLMKNIVFALTSAIDSRYSQRKYGKTLRQRLGFKRYWFAANGITLEPNLKKKLFLMLFCTTFFMFATIAPALASNLNEADCLPVFYFNFFALCLFFSLLFLSIPAMFWRWKDWCALSNMSKYLFALVNAHEVSKSNDTSINSKQEWVSKFPLILSLLFIASITFIFLTGTSEPVFDFFKKYQVGTLLFFLIITCTAIITTVTKKQNHIQFNQTNAAWMISLLRRYLFLCHRCGLEPVLVFDELDKLEELNDFWQECKNSREKQVQAVETFSTKKSSIRSVNTPQTIDNNKLDMFLVALSRLKSSLGAEFLWVLISGPKLSEHLQKHRHNRHNDSLGILATVITQEVLVGATDTETAEKIAIEKLNKQHSIESRQKITDHHVKELTWINNNFKVLWFRSYGNLSTMLRMIEKKDFLELEPSEKAKNIANAVHTIWNPKKQAHYFDLNTEEIYREYLQHNWSQIWIHAGMLSVANRFIKETISHGYFTEALLGNAIAKTLFQEESSDDLFTQTIHEASMDHRITALLSADPTLLQLVGEILLYRYLLDKGVIEVFIDEDAPIRFKKP